MITIKKKREKERNKSVCVVKWWTIKMQLWCKKYSHETKLEFMIYVAWWLGKVACKEERFVNKFIV